MGKAEVDHALWDKTYGVEDEKVQNKEKLMAKICISFYNGLYDSNDENKMGIYYESFFNGLREYGNDLLLFPLIDWQKDYTEIDSDTKEKILKFAPDLYISFNNVFYDMSFLECPIIIYEADAPQYWSNQDRLKTLEEKHDGGLVYYIVFGQHQAEYIKNIYGIRPEKIFIGKLFTSVRSSERFPTAEKIIPISFVGTRFGIKKSNEMGALADASEKDRNEYWKCLSYVIKNPYATKEEVILKNGIVSRRVQDILDIPGMLMMMSSEKRVRVLSSVVDLGLKLYGTRSWLERYHFDTRLNAAYVDKEIYSLRDNQDIYNRSKIGLNISHYYARDCFSWRVLDIMASNACLVTDAWSGIKKYFPDIPIPTYQDEHEARELCQNLLNDESLRSQIVAQCHEAIEGYRFIAQIELLEEITKLKLNNI